MIEFTINTNGIHWDDGSVIANYINLLYDFKRFSTNDMDWQEVKPILSQHLDYLKDAHKIEITITDQSTNADTSATSERAI